MLIIKYPPGEVPPPDDFEAAVLEEVEQAENIIEVFNFPLELILVFGNFRTGDVMHFLVMEDGAGLYLVPQAVDALAI